MDGKDLSLYKLFLEQIEKVRSTHRDSRRFYTTINVTGASTVAGLYARPGAFDGETFALLGCVILSLMAVVWYTATSHYDRAIQHKASVIAGIERQLGISYFAAENRSLTGADTPPRLTVERVIAVALAAGYAGIAVLLQVTTGFKIIRALTGDA